MLASHRPWLAGQPQGGLKYSSQSWLEIMSRFIALLAGKWVEHSLAMQDFYQEPPFRTIFDSTYYLLCTICSYILILQYVLNRNTRVSVSAARQSLTIRRVLKALAARPDGGTRPFWR